MSIKSSSFGGWKLCGKEAERFIQHMREDKPNPAAFAALERGRIALAKMARGEILTLRRNK